MPEPTAARQFALSVDTDDLDSKRDAIEHGYDAGFQAAMTLQQIAALSPDAVARALGDEEALIDAAWQGARASDACWDLWNYYGDPDIESWRAVVRAVVTAIGAVSAGHGVSR